MSLENDKENQSKYYLNYSKPPVLVMKRENRDINIVEWENILKFTKLDNIVAPLSPLSLLQFSDDILVDTIVGYTKLYSHREKTYISFETTNEKSCLFLSILLLSGRRSLILLC